MPPCSVFIRVHPWLKTCLMKRALPLAFLTLGLTLGLTLAARAEWVQTDVSLGWQQDGETIWQFTWDQTEGKPFFHPLRTPGGPELTALHPADHIWHYGLWFSWKYINEINYWEQNPQTDKSEGQTAWSAPTITTHRDGRAEIVLKVDYIHPTGRVDLTETRTMTVSPVGNDGAYHIDWSATFTAGTAGAYLDRTPLPDEPNGVIWGGYAGLSARLGLGSDPVEMVSAEGPLTNWVNDRQRPRTNAVAVTVYPQQPDSGSLAVLADADNTATDTGEPWYLINSQPSRFVCAAVLVPKPLQLAAGEVWTINYRLALRPAPWTAPDLSAALSAWQP